MKQRSRKQRLARVRYSRQDSLLIRRYWCFSYWHFYFGRV